MLPPKLLYITKKEKNVRIRDRPEECNSYRGIPEKGEYRWEKTLF